MDIDIERIRASLAELQRLDPACQSFGAQDHNYELNDPLAAEEVSQFETRHGIALPGDFRQFLTHAGNGGAGPHYGVFRLGQIDDGFEFRNWKENDGFVGKLSAPFPHVRRWNKRPKLPTVADDHPDYEAQLEQYDRIYWDPANVNGAIPICNLGCCIRHWLVVSGQEAGYIWVDQRTDDAGLFPYSKLFQRRYTFAQWYEQWLSASLRAAKRLSRRAAS